MGERLGNPWPQLDQRAEPGDTYLKGHVIMRILQKDKEERYVRFVSTPDQQDIVTPEITRIANDNK